MLALIILGALLSEADDDPSPAPPPAATEDSPEVPDVSASDAEPEREPPAARETAITPEPAADETDADETDADEPDGDEPDADDAPDRDEQPAPDVHPTPAPPTDTIHGDLEVHFIDVGQADATLLVHDEVTMLIDAGHWQRSDVVPYLRSQGVDHLDLVVVTHPHADHIGQFDQVMGAVVVDEVWWSGATATSATFGRALDALEASPAAYEEPRAGDTTRIGPLTIELLTPAVGASMSDLNDASLGMRITYGEVSFVLTGDAERAAERRMVADQSARLSADVLHLGHHGSNTSSTAEFLAAVDPSVAIYSAAADNTYGHPHREVIARIEQADITWYGTDVHGHVVVTTDGASFEVATTTATSTGARDTSSEHADRGR